MRQKKELNIQIGYRIKSVREKKDLTQEQFAELIDRTPQFVSDLERGVSGISIETLKVICEKLCISSDSILFSERGQHDDKVQELTNTLKLMSDSQFYIMQALTNAFLSASNTIAPNKNNGPGIVP